MLIGIACQKGVSHLGDGLNRWSAMHRLDAALCSANILSARGIMDRSQPNGSPVS
jgi:hypothetical protein